MRNARWAKELEQLTRDPPPGVTCWQAGDTIGQLKARAPCAFFLGFVPYRLASLELVGPAGSPYESGIFVLSVSLPQRYPLEPPAVRFVTRVYHPNVDTSGRICSDALKMPPSVRHLACRCHFACDRSPMHAGIMEPFYECGNGARRHSGADDGAEPGRRAHGGHCCRVQG